ncbi:response regulator transcription factor [Thiocystis violascens]|uniref:Response regulator n=1 Tax=Thiocystis violascens (strain ATCC 17096 / DSM 198 / 6111) TaxID=765911 RepID=I3Y7E1_THIV6|nr:response regulator [Thiocystis violascens]AFL72909.1 response regulator [Thiocystis violascens DSM 198]
MHEKQTVFLVDDDPAMRESLVLILELAGYRVRSFASPHDFLEAFSALEPGCLLLDQRMPEMSGIDLQELLLARGCPLPIIFLSAFGDVPTTVRAIRGGAIDFLEKPTSQDILLQRVEAALEEDRKRREEVAVESEIRQRFQQLTPREQDVMSLTTQGFTNKDIARQLGISPRTVENHRSRMMFKMGAANFAELCRLSAICTSASGKASLTNN